MDLTIARKFIEKLYINTCNVIEYQGVEDPETHITSMREVTVYENIPCKLSHETVKATGEGVGGSLFLSSRLILSPDLDIKPGSKIEVIHNGQTTAYKNSSEPAKFINHQEIMLSIFDGWS
ncbi:MAG: hypothetical protein IJV75_00190 [Alphaproteobacteria bacterium]|nr:hypothetical protein [Alphaproteobacteria bacterium]